MTSPFRGRREQNKDSTPSIEKDSAGGEKEGCHFWGALSHFVQMSPEMYESDIYIYIYNQLGGEVWQSFMGLASTRLCGGGALFWHGAPKWRKGFPVFLFG